MVTVFILNEIYNTCESELSRVINVYSTLDKALAECNELKLQNNDENTSYYVQEWEVL